MQLNFTLLHTTELFIIINLFSSNQYLQLTCTYSFIEMRRTSIDIPSVIYEVQTKSLSPPLNVACSVSQFLSHLFTGSSRKATLRCMNFLHYRVRATSRAGSSPHNSLVASRTPADSWMETDPTCTAPTRLPTELKANWITLSEYTALPNPTLPSVCLVHATQSVGMLREGGQTIIYHANSRACAVIFCVVVLLSCINKFTVADFPRDCNKPHANHHQKPSHFKQNTYIKHFCRSIRKLKMV
jgi:hypothetical protein